MDSIYIENLKKGCAFIPCYIEGIGKCSRIYFEDGGKKEVKYSISKTLNDYCALNLKSIKIIRKTCGNITGRKIITPLYVNHEVVLMPVKVMRPFVKGDACIGYINSLFIKEIDFKNTYILLKNGQEISFLDKSETIKKRFADCTIIKERLKSIC